MDFPEASPDFWSVVIAFILIIIPFRLFCAVLQSKIAAAVFAAKAQNFKFESLLSNYGLLSFGLRGMFFFIVMALNLEHAPIGAVHRHQLLMGAHFSNPAVCDEKDPVAEAGGRKPVRNEERGFIACQRIVF